MSAENVVVAVRSPWGETYLKGIMPHEAQEMLREQEMDCQPANQGLWHAVRICGYGHYEPVGFLHAGDDGDHAIERVRGILRAHIMRTTVAAIGTSFPPG